MIKKESEKNLQEKKKNRKKPYSEPKIISHKPLKKITLITSTQNVPGGAFFS